MADIVLLNGRFWTANPNQPWAEALAIKGDRILAAGRSEEISKLAHKNTRVIDLKGALAVPGFIDAHTHFLKGGFSLSNLDLRDVASREEFVRRIKTKALELEKGEWILDGNWDEQQWAPPGLPRRDWIDAVSSQNPVCLSRYDLHVALANSLALKIAGVSRETRPPAGGEIERDPVTGEPTGILRDAAVDLVARHIPEPSFKAKVKAVEAALEYAREHGVTSVHDMASASEFLPNLEVYKELFQQGRLSARIYMYLQIDQMEAWDEIKQVAQLESDWLSIGGLKGFADGSLGAGTAYFFEPYTDNPDNSGLLATQMFPEGVMEERILKADQRGLQVAIHAIGDKANFTVLNIFEKVQARNGRRDRRWRIEHAQHLRSDDIDRFAQLGVIASVQPYHAIDDGRWAETKIGKERCRLAFAFNSLLKAGVTLAFGSDWPVAPLDPIVAIYAAVTRQTTDGKNPEGWFPEQKISLTEALKGFTCNAAYAECAEKDKGSLEAGKLADLAVLDQDLFKITPEQIKTVKVTMTIAGGRVVFERATR